MDDLPAGVLGSILSGFSFSDLSTCAAVCATWRAAILQDEPLLLQMQVKRRTFQAPESMAGIRTCGKLPAVSHGFQSSHVRQTAVRPPAVLLRAAEVGNLEAMVALAEDMEGRGEGGRAMEWSKKAARLGHQPSQLFLGSLLYRGCSVHSVSRDAEEALTWLRRAAQGRPGKGGKGGRKEEKTQGEAALLLGYMYLDGEGTQRADVSEAIKWLKMARDLGCVEAEAAVGWLWNTGQY